MSVIKDKNLQMIFGVTLMAVIGVSLISPAFPAMQKAFGLSNAEIGFFITVFTLPGIFISLIIGIFSDRRGRKKIVVPSLIIFALSGGAIAFVRDYNMVLLLRFLQGSAASGLSTLSMAMIGDVFSGEERAEAMGYNGSVLAIGTASYPVIGGLLATLGWYYPFYVFFISLPIGIIIFKYYDEIFISGTDGYSVLIRNILKEINNPHMLLLVIANICTFILLYGSYLTYFTLFLDERFAANSFVIGLILSCMSITTAITSSMTKFTFKMLGGIIPIILGFILYAVAFAMIWAMPNIWFGVPAVLLYGVGQGINLPVLQTTIINSVSSDSKGAISALYSSNLRIGQSLGPILMSLIFSIFDFSGVFLSSFALALAMASLLIMSRIKGLFKI